MDMWKGLHAVPVASVDEFQDPVQWDFGRHRHSHPPVTGQPGKTVRVDKAQPEGKLRLLVGKLHFNQDCTGAQDKCKEDLFIVTVGKPSPELPFTYS